MQQLEAMELVKMIPGEKKQIIYEGLEVELQALHIKAWTITGVRLSSCFCNPTTELYSLKTQGHKNKQIYCQFLSPLNFNFIRRQRGLQFTGIQTIYRVYTTTTKSTCSGKSPRFGNPRKPTRDIIGAEENIEETQCLLQVLTPWNADPQEEMQAKILNENEEGSRH